MALVSSCRSEYLELRELAQAVIGPLKRGLQSFNNVSVMLLQVDANVIYPGCQTFEDIRRQIESMKLQMEESEQVAMQELQRQDRETERLTATQSWLADQKKQRECQLGELEARLESLRCSLQYYNMALETVRGHLSSAEDTLRCMREKRDEAERVRNAGIGVFFIPIVGWIAGAIMVGVGETEMNQASYAVDQARNEVQNFEAQVRSFSDKMSEFNSSIYQTQCHIQDADTKIRETETELWNVHEKRQVVADLQDKMRRAVHQVGLLCGVGNVAELHTRRLILLEPVMKVMEEMTKTLGQITGDDLLHTEGIKSLMQELKTNQDKLKQLQPATNNYF